jgi:hypothetical protein
MRSRYPRPFGLLPAMMQNQLVTSASGAINRDPHVRTCHSIFALPWTGSPPIILSLLTSRLAVYHFPYWRTARLCHGTNAVPMVSVRRFISLGRRLELPLPSARSWLSALPMSPAVDSVRQWEVNQWPTRPSVGYVIGGRAELYIEGQLVELSPGDSWLVPAGAEHRCRILEPFTAVEATTPPAQVHARDRL